MTHVGAGGAVPGHALAVDRRALGEQQPHARGARGFFIPILHTSIVQPNFTYIFYLILHTYRTCQVHTFGRARTNLGRGAGRADLTFSLMSALGGIAPQTLLPSAENPTPSTLSPQP